MINGVFDVNEIEYQRIKTAYMATWDVYFAEVDGRRIVDETSFYKIVGAALGEPEDLLAPITNMNWFYDDVTTLGWFEYDTDCPRYKQYVLAFCHPDAMWTSSLWNSREFFQDVANFWKNEVEHVVVGGQARGFAVYLVHETQSVAELPS